VASMFRDAVRAVSLVDAAMRTAEFNVARLEARAAEGGTTLTELADHLVRERDIPFKIAHAIVAGVMAARRWQPGTDLGETLARVSTEVLGAELRYSDAAIATIISPRHFVDVRRTSGGPAPTETARALDESRRRLENDRLWLARVRDVLSAADKRLRERSRAL